MENNQSKVVVVTGGNSGIGLATAQAFQKSGAKVVITASSDESFEIAQKEYSAYMDVRKVDVSKVEEVSDLFEHVHEKYGGIDVLFANAGVAAYAPTEGVSEDFYDHQFDINVKGVYFSVSKALPYLNNNSSVVMTSSVLAYKGIPNASVYSATKAAIRSFARTWTAEIPVEKVRFNVISPGPIDTPMHEKNGMPPEQLKQYLNQISDLVPAKRFGDAGEVANLVQYLSSNEAKYIAGAEISIDGGFAQV